MPNDLSPAEKEDREADRLLNRKPAPSRKHRERRAPRHEQRRRRVREKDPDTTKRRESSVSDADLDRYLRDLELMTRDHDAPDEDFDFDEAIDALSDVADVPPSVAERLVEERGEDGMADLLHGHQMDMDPGRLDEMDRALGLAAFNGAFPPMSSRTGAYHGVRDVRGNPTDSPNTVALPDRRYFTNKDYDAIVKFAGKLLDEDWLKFGWDDGAKDAPMRAALDLSIQTANGNAYQSKIDAETYDLLLNRLTKWGYDTFSDTVLPMKAPTGDNRSASAMTIKKTASYQQIVQVASDLRDTNPAAALQIVKSLRSLVSTEAEPAGTISEAAAVGAPKAGVASARPVAPPVTAAGDDLAEVPLPVLVKLAAASPAAKAVLGPFILAAAKKKDKKKGKGKIPPQFLKNMKKKGEKKASIAAEDTSW